jgi:hypothetical protein
LRRSGQAQVGADDDVDAGEVSPPFSGRRRGSRSATAGAVRQAGVDQHARIGWSMTYVDGIRSPRQQVRNGDRRDGDEAGRYRVPTAAVVVVSSMTSLYRLLADAQPASLPRALAAGKRLATLRLVSMPRLTIRRRNSSLRCGARTVVPGSKRHLQDTIGDRQVDGQDGKCARPGAWAFPPVYVEERCPRIEKVNDPLSGEEPIVPSDGGRKRAGAESGTGGGCSLPRIHRLRGSTMARTQW